jgi:hypothetical protein
VIRVCYRVLAVSLFLTANLPAQVTWGRITSYLERQPTKVFYWMVPLVTPRPAVDSGQHFLAVNFRSSQSNSKADSLLLLKSGCESLDSLVFYFVPFESDSGIMLITAVGDTIRYVESKAPISADNRVIERTQGVLDTLSNRLQRYGALKSQVNQFSAPVGTLAGAGLLSLGAVFLVTGNSDYRAVTAGLSFGAALVLGLDALNRLSDQNERIRRSQEAESQLPPGF